ncbi:MAG: 4-carboxymuconolactone decarboxylase [Variovorax sp.]|nr:MAG: 4-carboxymuconolactone decarboxylase [Variovorax sp.]
MPSKTVKPSTKSQDYANGLAMRKKVLGADYVEATLRDANDLLMPFQELLTEFAWGKVWTREGLDLRTRSLLTVAMCIALNRPHEIKLHLRGAVRNGVSNLEIRELLLHAFIYCGGPACVDAAAVIKACLPEIEAQERGAAAKPKKAIGAGKRARKKGASPAAV